MLISTILILATAYLIGAIPSAYVIGRRYGVNLRQIGDGNLGGLNALRTLGWKPALVVGLVDFSKGAFAAWLADSLSPSPVVPYLAALAAALGHDFSIFTHFEGGQGMAAILGSLLFLHPLETLLGIGFFMTCFLIFRNWDLSWGIGMASMVASAWYWQRSLWQIGLVVVLIVSIGFKKWLDMPLARQIRERHS